jgi:hypothetical protein
MVSILFIHCKTGLQEKGKKDSEDGEKDNQR